MDQAILLKGDMLLVKNVKNNGEVISAMSINNEDLEITLYPNTSQQNNGCVAAVKTGNSKKKRYIKIPASNSSPWSSIIKKPHISAKNTSQLSSYSKHNKDIYAYRSVAHQQDYNLNNSSEMQNQMSQNGGESELGGEEEDPLNENQMSVIEHQQNAFKMSNISRYENDPPGN